MERTIYRFANGYVFKTKVGLNEANMTEVRKDYERVSADSEVKLAFEAQLDRWVKGLDQEVSEFYGESWTLLRFGDSTLRDDMRDMWWMWESYLPAADEECWRRAASTVVKYRGVNLNAWSDRRKRSLLIEDYREMSSEEWVFRKDALQRLIAAGEGWRLDPAEEEVIGYEAMFGLMARAAWNASLYDHGRQLSIPSARLISAEAEKLIRRWEMRRMV